MFGNRMSMMRSTSILNIIGIGATAILIAALWLIYLTLGFSKDYVLCIYNIAFSIALRLTFSTRGSVFKRLKAVVSGSVVLVILLTILVSIFLNYVGQRRAYEGGPGVSALIMAAYLGLPIIVLSAVESLVNIEKWLVPSSGRD